MKIIETERLLLRTWKKEDAEPYYQMNQAPRVIEFLPKSLSMEEVKKFIADQDQCFLENRYALFAVEEKKSGVMIGFLGLEKMEGPYSFAPAVAIGWRLAAQSWGQGYATEGARAVLEYGFKTLGLDEIVSVTAVENNRSRRVMEKIGMKRDLQEDFEHSKLPKEHRLSKHVLYRLKKSEKSCLLFYSTIE